MFKQSSEQRFILGKLGDDQAKLSVISFFLRAVLLEGPLRRL